VRPRASGRAVRRAREQSPLSARGRSSRRWALIGLGDGLLDAAGDLHADLRSLDAIHVAAARSLGADLDLVATYDRRMSAAAAAIGLTVAAAA
jgi:predicted nucleic acid-binding protein